MTNEHPWFSRRGNAMVTMLNAGALLGFGALAIDVALIRVAKGELQASLDAAALSAAQELDGTVTGINRAGTRATKVAAANEVLGRPVHLAPSEIRLGTIDPVTRRFVPWQSGDDPFNVDTLDVVHPPESVFTALGGLAFGWDQYRVRAPSTARRPKGSLATGRSMCYLPLAVPECAVSGLAPNTNPLPFKFSFNSGNGSNSSRITWALADANVNADDVKRQLLGQCSGDPMKKGQYIHVTQGNLTSATQSIGEVINGRVASTPATLWDAEAYGPLPKRNGQYANPSSKSDVSSTRWGRVLEGVVPLVDAGSCETMKLSSGQLPITRFAWAVIYDVSSSGSDKNLFALLDVNKWHTVWGTPDPTIVSNVKTFGDPVLTELGTP